MNQGVVEPGHDGSNGELTSIKRLVVTAFHVFADTIQPLSNDEKNDLFEAILTLKEDSSFENKEAVCKLFEEILQHKPIKIEAIPLGDLPKGNPWSCFVAERLKELRNDKGLTQKELAKRSGLRQPHVSRIERGEMSPTRKTIEKLAQGLGVEMKEFDPSA